MAKMLIALTFFSNEGPVISAAINLDQDGNNSVTIEGAAASENALKSRALDNLQEDAFALYRSVQSFYPDGPIREALLQKLEEFPDQKAQFLSMLASFDSEGPESHIGHGCELDPTSPAFAGFHENDDNPDDAPVG